MIGIQFLQSHALFGGLTDGQVDLIRPMLEEGEFHAGDYIIREGEEGDKLFFIYEGKVEILKVNPGGGDDEVCLASLGVGDTFGEMELIDIQPRCASVKALEDVRVLTLSSHDLYDIYHTDTKAYLLIVMNLARELSRRLRHSDAVVASSLFARHITEEKQD